MKNLALAIEWKLTELELFKGSNIQTKEEVLVVWEVEGMNQPKEKELEKWCADYALYLEQQEVSDQEKMDALKVKLNLSDQEILTLGMLVNGTNK